MNSFSCSKSFFTFFLVTEKYYDSIQQTKDNYVIEMEMTSYTERIIINYLGKIENNIVIILMILLMSKNYGHNIYNHNI